MTEERRLYPITGHRSCPVCGCEERLGQEKILDLIEEGELEDGAFPKGPCWQVPLADLNKPIRVEAMSINKPRLPLFLVYWDICANPDCLHVYVTGVEFVMQEIDIPRAPLQAPMRGNLPRGLMDMPFGRG